MSCLARWIDRSHHPGFPAPAPSPQVCRLHLPLPKQRARSGNSAVGDEDGVGIGARNAARKTTHLAAKAVRRYIDRTPTDEVSAVCLLGFVAAPTGRPPCRRLPTGVPHIAPLLDPNGDKGTNAARARPPARPANWLPQLACGHEREAPPVGLLPLAGDVRPRRPGRPPGRGRAWSCFSRAGAGARAGRNFTNESVSIPRRLLVQVYARRGAMNRWNTAAQAWDDAARPLAPHPPACSRCVVSSCFPRLAAKSPPPRRFRDQGPQNKSRRLIGDTQDTLHSLCLVRDTHSSLLLAARSCRWTPTVLPFFTSDMLLGVCGCVCVLVQVLMESIKSLSHSGNPRRTVVTVDDLHSKHQVT